MPSTKGRGKKIISAGDSFKKIKQKKKISNCPSPQKLGKGEVLKTKDHRLFLVLPML